MNHSGEAPEDTDLLERLIRGVPYFQGLARLDVARLVGALERVTFPAGTVIFKEGAEGDALYLVLRGTVAVTLQTEDGERLLTEITSPGYLGELGLLLDRRTATARAATDVELWRLPRARFAQLVRERPGIGLAMATALAARLDQRSREHLGAPIAAARPTVRLEPLPTRGGGIQRMIGGAVALGVPAALWWVAPPTALSVEGWRVVLVLIGGALGWLLEPVPDFVVALLMAAVWGIAELAPLSRIFAGFTSSSWLIAFGALGLAAAMVRSGLLFRTALFSLRIFPATHRGQVLALLVGGIVTTPLVPLATARTSAVAPLTRELSQAMGYPPRSRAGAALAFAGLMGYGSFSSIFLTGLAMNFFVLELLPAPLRERFDWLTWLVAAAVAGGVLFGGLTAALLVLFRADAAATATPQTIRRQVAVLGPPSPLEAVAGASLAVLFLGLLLQPVLHFDTAWVAVVALAVALAGGALDREGFRSAIDWGFLVLFGIMLSTGGVLNATGVDRWIAGTVGRVSALGASPAVLALLVAVFVMAVRAVLPRQPATLLLALSLVPLAPGLGLHPWVMGFVVLLAGNAWVHPSQSDWYRITREATGGTLFTDRQGLLLGAAFTAVTLAAIVASLPIWRLLGLLP